MQLQKKILCYMQLHLGHDFYNIYLKSGITYIASRSVPHPPIKRNLGARLAVGLLEWRLKPRRISTIIRHYRITSTLLQSDSNPRAKWLNGPPHSNAFDLRDRLYQSNDTTAQTGNPRTASGNPPLRKKMFVVQVVSRDVYCQLRAARIYIPASSLSCRQ